MASKFITVSVEIMHDKNLSPNQKFILAEIEQLCSLEHGCYASNTHFAELIGISKSGISNAINKLVDDGYVETIIKIGTRNRERIIRRIHSDVDVYTQVDEGIHSDVHGIHSDVESKENRHINIQSNIPTWVNEGAWNSWVSYRAEIKKKLSPSMIKQQLKFLEERQLQHVEIIEQSIRNGWTGLFEIKGGSKTAQNTKVAQEWVADQDIMDAEVCSA